MSSAIAILGTLLCMHGPADTAVRVEGDYLESRTADVYTGPCFSNAEVFLTGHQALMAWQVRTGQWNGVDVSGLVVAAAVRGTTTFQLDDPEKARAVFIVDDRATEAQRDALVSMAKSMGGARLARSNDVRIAKMSLFIEEHASESETSHRVQSAHHAGPAAPRACFWAEGLAEINTRPMEPTDHVCGNEVLAYAPLAKGVSALPAYTIANVFKGKGLDTQWADHNCRGSYVGHFAY